MCTTVSILRLFVLLALATMFLSGCTAAENVTAEPRATTIVTVEESDRPTAEEGQRPIESATVELTKPLTRESEEMMTERVLVEIRVPADIAADDVFALVDSELTSLFELDTTYPPVPSSPPEELSGELEANNEQVMLVRGTVAAGEREALTQHPLVVGVWTDARIEPFDE